MPARTNDFQRLIAVVQAHLDPGSHVAESVLLPDRITGTKREVDIVVSGSIGKQEIVVSFECRDRTRDADITWVEQMQAKHARLSTNALVLVSHSPFTPEAQRIADVFGIRCFVLDDVDPTAAERLFPDVSSLWGKTWESTVERVTITVEASEDLPTERVRVEPDTTLFIEDGTVVGDVGQLSHTLINAEVVNKRLAQEVKPEHTYLEFGWEPPALGGSRLCLQKTDPLMLRPISYIRIVAKCVVTVEEFPLRHGLYDATRVAWGKGSLLGHPTMLVASASPDGEPRISLKFLTK